MSALESLLPLLAPRSIAVVGASDRPGNLGGVAVRLLQRYRFAGPVWPVNPGAQSVAGLPCHASAMALPGVPDVALLALPAPAIAQAVRDCAAAGIRHGIAWAGGFTEIGGEGIERQRTLRQACEDTGFRLCGPNGLGIVNAPIGFAGTFSASLADLGDLLPGSISMVSQSGGMAMQALALAHQHQVGFRYVVSCGNEVSLRAADFVRALVDDAGTRVIAMYLEAVIDGAALVDTLQSARRAGKAVVVLKGGASADSRRAALAHTGRMAGEARTFEAVFRESAAIHVRSLEELLDVCLLLHGLGPDRLPRSNRVMVTTFGGGAGVLAVDQCEAVGLVVPPTPPEVRDAVAPWLTPIASTANPMDLTPQSVNEPARLAQLPQALVTLAASAEFDAVLFLTASTAHREVELVDLIDGLGRESGKPVVVTWTLASDRARALLAERGIHVFTDSSRAVRALGQVARHVRAHDDAVDGATPAILAFDWAEWTDRIGRRRVVTEDVVAAMLQAAGVGVAQGACARTIDDAVEIAARLGVPVAVKGLSADLPHRAAEGFLSLGVPSATQAGRIHAEFATKAGARGLQYDGSWIQAMQVAGIELLVAAYRDPQFGTFVVCGCGGSLTELVRDVVVFSAPATTARVERRLRELRVFESRGAQLEPEALRSAAAYVARFAAWIAGAPWPRFTLELNPVIVSREAAIAVDGLLVIDDDDTAEPMEHRA